MNSMLNRLSDASRHPAIAGIVLGVIAVFVIWLLPLAWALDSAGLLLAAVGSLYIGTAVARERGGVVWIEFVIAGVCLLLAFFGTRITAWLLVIGFAGHAFWTLLHQGEWSGLAHPARWFIGFCVIFDAILAVFFVWRFSLLVS